MIRNTFVLLMILVVLSGTPALLAAADEAGLNAAMSMQKAFVDVARTLKPSVVNIRIERTSSGGISWLSPEDAQRAVLKNFSGSFSGVRSFNAHRNRKLRVPARALLSALMAQS